MGSPVMYFDIGCRNKDETSAFYSELFEWEVDDVSDFSAQLNTGSERGIDGAVTALGHEPHNYVMIYIEVDDMETYLEKAEELGGEIAIGPLDTPDGRQFAWVKDPEGTTFGLLGPQP